MKRYTIYSYILLLLLLLLLFSCVGTKNSGDVDKSNDDISPLEKVVVVSNSDSDGVVDILDSEPISLPVILESPVMAASESKPIQHLKDSPKDLPTLLMNTEVSNDKKMVNINDLNINTGEMSYDIPLNMEVGKVHTVRLRISRKTGNSNLTVGFENDTTVYKIETGSVMSVLLLDPNPDGVNKQFEIVNLTNGQQALEDDGRVNEWSWVVTPIRGGEGKLKLIINITKQTEFGPMERSITVFEKDIDISTNHKYSIRKFLYDNWEWFASSVAIPFFVFLWRKRKYILSHIK